MFTQKEKKIMAIRKVKGGYATKHCKGKDKGKIIKKFKTYREALAQHRAIQASKRKRKKR